jgi:putative effector of murein hydrolase
MANFRLNGAMFNRCVATGSDVCGFAIGVAAHGIGTARAFQISEEAGAFAGLGMAMNGVLTAFVLPICFRACMAWVSSR